MKVLRRGSRGSAVGKWQTFLRGCNIPILVDNDFGPRTEGHTKAWQKSNRLVDDGIVGNASYGMALTQGFMAVGSDLMDGVGSRRMVPWPVAWDDHGDGSRTARQVGRLSWREKTRRFGSFNHKPAPTARNPEAIKITGRHHFKIMRVHTPELVGVKGFPKSGYVFMNAAAAEQFRDLIKAWDKSGVIGDVLSWAGSYAPRYIRGSRTILSNHAYGSAFDINVAWNGLGRRPALRGDTGSVARLLKAAGDHKFFWGGQFSRPDGMHFEIGK